MNVLPQQRRSSSDDNMIPLINIVFLLLIFFMVAGQIQKRPNASIDVPTMNHLETPANLQHFVEINANGILSMDENTITPSQLANALLNLSAISPTTPIDLTLVIDQRVTARQLEDVLSELRPLKNIVLSILVENGE